jgi:tRNA modification GTPase
MTHIDNAIEALDAFTQDIAAMDIEQALARLGEIDGRAVSEDVVARIFSKFCVGK